MRRCTKVEVFCAVMNALKESDGMIIISLIENFLCDYVGERKVKEEVEKAVGKALENFVKTVDETVKRLPKTRFAIVEPMERPAVGWYRFFEADLVNLNDGQAAMEVVPEANESPSIMLVSADVEEQRRTLEQRLEDVERQMVSRQHNDSLVFARIREELDFLANVKMRIQLL